MRRWLAPSRMASAVITLALLVGVVLVLATSMKVADLGPIIVGSVALAVVIASLLDGSSRQAG